ncbi:gliding motility-associated protein GldE [Sandaracinomonas limnophila]|uniref:Gliding motility-associated protein GldE n=1 Tax=Sandaracinomonas limnophila TaxID=1862386 RepID=A0A437PUI8_9BACT|nr:gliding motility-associated protein GldE [Sandaracinomonas limnophila]RVU25929.1 gliding motility-associated protein GldE [Sandaracinomonas limnophila]
MDADPYPSPLLLQIEPQFNLGSVLFIGFILLLLLFLTALLAGAEVALFSLNNEQRAFLRDSDGSQERTLTNLLNRPQKLLATLLISINFVNIIFITLANYLTEQLVGKESIEEPIVVLVLLFSVTFVITFFGELIPKVWSQQNNLKFALFTGPIIEFFSFVVAPLSKTLMGISNLIEKRVERKSYTLTTQELNHALEITTDENTSEREKDILKGILNFGNISVKGVMRPRPEIIAFETSLNYHELMDKINKNGYSRVPVFVDTLDKIEGVLYIKDLLKHIDKDENFNWQELIHQPFFVPENKKIDDLLYDFQEKRVHIAIVVNEYGETKGLVTMEDIIEEIVGEINDEFDVEELDYKVLENNVYLFEAKTSLMDFHRALDLEQDYFEEAKGESETLGGMLIELFGRIPSAGEEISFKEFEFKIQSVDLKRIKKVRVTFNQPIRKDDAL